MENKEVVETVIETESNPRITISWQYKTYYINSRKNFSKG